MTPEQQNRSSENDAQKKSEPDELNQLKHLLRQAMPPLPPDQLESRADLWPQLRARIESQSTADRANSSREYSRGQIRVPWFDWVLAALAAAALLVFPGIIPALLYHF